ncbi:hypothetical protein EHO59_16715 [Leptospira semungkisensis]|uniref:Uncharacterized protein n=1 Tax=Leptospira semungkisensis TaxID=2484985 RepID=A0A4R9FP10_9LEPT|nr:ankyrin repeat domain-containing protein [Leptospira semungkisensis]TGJ99496.1 hypothetical protein EHO59_16715 [Leptospira semungkisensis]
MYKFLILSISILSLSCTSNRLFYSIKDHDRGRTYNLLRENPELLNTRDIRGNTPLHYAILADDEELIAKFIRDGKDINARNNIGFAAVHYAAETQNLFALELLKKAGASFDVLGDPGFSPLSIAIFNNAIYAVKFLVEKAKMSPNGMAREVEVPLVLAIQLNNLEIARYLIESGVSTDAKSNKGITPFFVAAGKDDIPFLEYLMSKGFPIDVPSTQGYTALNYSILLGKFQISDFLLEKQANPNLANYRGLNSVLIACMGGSLPILENVVRHGGKLSSVDKEGKTALHYAAFNGNEDLIKFLLNKGADKLAKDASNRTPYNIAEERGNTNILPLLKI